MKFSELAIAKFGRFLAKRLMRTSEYSFTQDYVFDRVHLWMQHLNELRGKENIRLLEVGSYEARSAVWFLEHILTHPSSTITCIDPFFSRMAEIRFDHNIIVSGGSSKVTKIKGKSQEALRLLKEDSFDVIYIDGSHRAVDVQTDASLSWPLLKRGGILIFDDYLWNLELPVEDRPKMAIDNFLSDFRSQLEILHKGYQVIARKVEARSFLP
jgi:predicted O-methyltransferase YrrM